MCKSAVILIVLFLEGFFFFVEKLVKEGFILFLPIQNSWEVIELAKDSCPLMKTQKVSRSGVSRNFLGISSRKNSQSEYVLNFPNRCIINFNKISVKYYCT